MTECEIDRDNEYHIEPHIECDIEPDIEYHIECDMIPIIHIISDHKAHT